jgi:hypothetical protein
MSTLPGFMSDTVEASCSSHQVSPSRSVTAQLILNPNSLTRAFLSDEVKEAPFNHHTLDRNLGNFSVLSFVLRFLQLNF